jgi:DNA repair exonuclease SbcCD ATPase subunit
MKFVSVEFKNVFAYGEETQRIDYSDEGKLILLKGISGAGKSAILSMPTLVLYGKLKSVSKSGIANRVNKHGWVRGVIRKGQHEYVIEREFSPNSLKIWKDGEEIDSFGSSDAEDYIKTEIIEIPLNTFNNMVTISMKNFTSFLSMSPSDRKQVIDEIFDVKIVNLIAEQIKKDAKELGNSINGDNQTMYSLSQTLSNANRELAQIQQKNTTPENADKIETNNQEIASLNQTLAQYAEAGQQVTQKANEENIALNNKNTEIRQKNTQIAEKRSAVNIINDKIRLYNQSKCPTCATPFTGEAFDTLKQQLVDVKKKKEDEVTSLVNELGELNSEYTTIQEKIKKIGEAKQKIDNGSYQIRLKISQLQNENTLILEKQKASAEYQAVQNIIDQTTLQIDSIREQVNRKTKKLNYLQTLLKIYSLDGVLKLVVEQWIPVLNDEIAENLLLLNFPYTLKFDNKLNAEVSDLGANVPIETLSEGEKTRLNICILTSFYKILQRKFTSLNILSLDETVSTLDPTNSGALLMFLKAFADENNINCIVVSHTDLALDEFDEVIEVEKHMGFSHMTIQKIN